MAVLFSIANKFWMLKVCIDLLCALRRRGMAVLSEMAVVCKIAWLTVTLLWT